MSNEPSKPCCCEPTTEDEDRNSVWCERHQIRKSLRWVRHCQTRPELRAAWDDFEGPGQELPPEDRGAGDTIARTLGTLGKNWKRWYRNTFGRSCGCGRRQATLNKLTAPIYSALRRKR